MPTKNTKIPTFLSYTIKKKLTKHPKKFNKNTIENITKPETTNNTSTTNVLIPLLTLKLPTSTTTTILITAFQNYNIHPNPLLFQSKNKLI